MNFQRHLQRLNEAARIKSEQIRESEASNADVRETDAEQAVSREDLGKRLASSKPALRASDESGEDGQRANEAQRRRETQRAQKQEQRGVDRAHAIEELRAKMQQILVDTALVAQAPDSQSASNADGTDARGAGQIDYTAAPLARFTREQQYDVLCGIAPWTETEHGGFHLRRARQVLGSAYGEQALSDLSDEHFQALSAVSLLPLNGALSEHCLFLDTETTGLGTGSGVLPFLIGIGWYEAGAFHTEQLLLGSPDQEPAVLEHLLRRIQRAELLITFNGKSFDWPLLETRFILNRMRVPRFPRHLDLLHVARRLHKPRLARCSLKHLEVDVLSFQRVGDIEGWEVAARYQHYLRGGNAESLIAVLEHNHQDVVAMAALVSAYADPDCAVARRDALGVARTLRRGGHFERALSLCSVAIDAEAPSAEHDAEALLRLRAELHVTLGRRESAVADLEQIRHCPVARLRLAKLYEHHLKRPDLALSVCENGTAEPARSAFRRVERLRQKLARSMDCSAS